MKLRWKLIKPLGIFIFFALAILGVGLNYGLSSYLLQLELIEHRQRLHIVENVITSSLYSLEAWTFDMAHWDETYDFVEGRNKNYIASNFPPSAFEHVEEWNSSAVVKPDAIAFVHQDGRILDYIKYDQKTKKRIFKAPEILETYIKSLLLKLKSSPDNELLSFCELENQFYQLALIPVKDSQGIKETSFYFLTIRAWNELELKSVERLTGLDAKFFSHRGNIDWQKENISTTDNQIKGLLSYRDPLDKNLFQVEVLAERTTFKLGQKGSKLFVGFILSFAGVLLLTMLLIFDTIVLRRISRLNTTVQKSKAESDEIDNIVDQGNDEISQLSVDLFSLLTQLKNSSELDPLTGLENRRAFYSKVSKLTHEIQNLKSPDLGFFSVIQFDIDKFKSINDTHGHPQGDLVIKTLAALIATKKNRNICAARFGGEEFVIFMYSRSADEACLLAESVRTHLEGIEIPLLEDSEKNLRTTVSAGVCTRNIKELAHLEEMLELADKALYHSKNSGRNRVTQYESLKQAS